MSVLGKVFVLTALISFWGVQAMATDGLITVRSSLRPMETMNRLEAEVRAKGMTLFAHVDHAAGANRSVYRCGPPTF